MKWWLADVGVTTLYKIAKMNAYILNCFLLISILISSVLKKISIKLKNRFSFSIIKSNSRINEKSIRWWKCKYVFGGKESSYSPKRLNKNSCDENNVGSNQELKKYVLIMKYTNFVHIWHEYEKIYVYIQDFILY